MRGAILCLLALLTMGSQVAAQPPPPSGYFFAKMESSGRGFEPTFNNGKSLYYRVRSLPARANKAVATLMDDARFLISASTPGLQLLGLTNRGQGWTGYTAGWYFPTDFVDSFEAVDVCLGTRQGSWREAFVAGDAVVRTAQDEENWVVLARNFTNRSSDVRHNFGENGIFMLSPQEVGTELKGLKVKKVLIDQASDITSLVLEAESQSGGKSLYLARVNVNGVLHPNNGLAKLDYDINDCVDFKVVNPTQGLIPSKHFFVVKHVRAGLRSFIRASKFDLNGIKDVNFTEIKMATDLGNPSNFFLSSSSNSLVVVAAFDNDTGNNGPHRLVGLFTSAGRRNSSLSGEGKRWLVGPGSRRLKTHQIALTPDGSKLYLAETMPQANGSNVVVISRWLLDFQGQGRQDTSFGFNQGVATIANFDLATPSNDPFDPTGRKIEFQINTVFLEPIANDDHRIVVAGAATLVP